MGVRPRDRVRPDGRKFYADLTARLLAFAEEDFRRQKPTESGGTLADDFQKFEEQMGRKHDDDVQEWPFPESVAYLYGWFWEISAGRPFSSVGPLPIPAAEYLAWCALSRVRLERWEVDALRQLDSLYLRIAGE